jgi:hypothetical protein
MKKIFSLFLFVLISAFVLAQTTYTSVQNGDWNTASTWDNGVPEVGGSVIVINNAVSFSISFYLDPIGSLTINSAGKLTHSDGLIVLNSIIVEGEYERSSASATTTTVGIMTVNGTYIHNYDESGQQSIPSGITWGESSLCKITGVTTNTNFPGLPGDLNFVEIDCPSLTEDIEFKFDWDHAFDSLIITNTNDKFIRFTQDDDNTHVVTGAITIGAQGRLSLTQTSRVEMIGTLTNNAGPEDLLLRSDISGTASLIYDGTGLEATVQQRFEQGRWYLVSIPFNNTETYDYWDGNNDAFMRPYLSPGDGWGDYFGQPSEVLNVGVGYELWQTTLFNFADTGTLLSGNYNLPIAAGGTVDPDWNFLGNPYPCGIDWAQVSDKTNVVGGAFYVYNGSSYVNHNGTSGTANSSVIPPMQGFFVKHNGGTSIGINNSHKAHAGKPIYKKSMNQVTYSNHFKIKAATATAESVCVIYQQEEATNGTDDLYDAPILFNNDPNFMEVFSLAGERRSCINIYNDYPYDVFLGFRVPEGGAEFTLEAFDFRFIDATFTIILEDMLTGTMLTLDENTSYTFSTEEAGMLEDRIVLHLNSTVGIDENENTHFNVYAMRNQIFVEGTYNQTYDISVYNVLGQAVYFDSRLQNNQIIELSVPAGTYIVKLRSEYGMQTEKINIAH